MPSKLVPTPGMNTKHDGESYYLCTVGHQRRMGSHIEQHVARSHIFKVCNGSYTKNIYKDVHGSDRDKRCGREDYKNKNI
jgi:hypothetical protein